MDASWAKGLSPADRSGKVAADVAAIAKQVCSQTPELAAQGEKFMAALGAALGGAWASQVGAGPSATRQTSAAAAPQAAGGANKPDTSTGPCFVCGVRPSPGSKHKLCGGCKAVVYCGKDCQVKHWKEGGHKQECQGKKS